MKKITLSVLLLVCIICTIKSQNLKTTSPEPSVSGSDTLVVLWINSDKEASYDMLLSYAGFSDKNSWWNHIIFIVWGPSGKLIVSDQEVQEKIKTLIDHGNEFFACKVCADKYGISSELEKLGITIKYTGEDLTYYLKNRYPILTF